MHGRNLVLPLIYLAAAATVPARGQVICDTIATWQVSNGSVMPARVAPFNRPVVLCTFGFGAKLRARLRTRDQSGTALAVQVWPGSVSNFLTV
jgi:hypothetical protein